MSAPPVGAAAIAGAASPDVGFRFERLTGSIGVRVSGLDVAQPLRAADVAALRSLWHEYGVLVLETPDSTDAQLKEFAQNFGPLHVTKYASALSAEHPEVTVLDEAAKKTVAGWHTDSTFEARPPLGAVLRMVVRPDVGGDTCWATMYGAYDALSSRIQRLLDELTALHDASLIYRLRKAEGLESEFLQREAVHPCVFVDPVTHRRGLFVNSHYTQRINELSEPESRRLLALLFEHVKAPELQVRVRWEPGMMVMWNNPITQHYAVPDYEGRRVVHRVTVLSPDGE
jgi:taurine dioxygenase